MAIKLIIDSASDVDKREADELGAILMPIEVRFGEEIYQDGADITPELFYDKLERSGELPQTSQIPPQRFAECFQKIVNNGDEAVAVLLSSKLSGTYENARQAAEPYGEKIFVVDSLNASVGERLLLNCALRWLKEGRSAKEIAAGLEEAKTHVQFMALLDTLKYLRKGGRISAVTAAAGNLLAVKPVVAVIDGEVKLVGKAMGSKKGNNLLNTLAKEKGVDFTMPYGVVYSGTDDALLARYVRDSENIWKRRTDALPTYRIGSTIGAHIGPGAIGVAFFEEKK